MFGFGHFFYWSVLAQVAYNHPIGNIYIYISGYISGKKPANWVIIYHPSPFMGTKKQLLNFWQIFVGAFPKNPGLS